MNIVQVPIGDIVPYDKNPRNIPESAVKKVAASLQEFGFAQPIVVDKANVVIVGHTRLQAAQSLGFKQVPVYKANLTPVQAKAYRLADNRTNEESSWINDVLLAELDGIDALHFDLSIVGFDVDELAEMRFDGDFLPGTDQDQGRLDEKKQHTCPECGHAFAD